MLIKPDSCTPCPLSRTGTGFVPPSGPLDSPLLFMAEAPGRFEAQQGEALVGESGAMFNRLLWLLSENRSRFRLHNVLSCQPPGNELLNRPWEQAAIAHCSQYRDPVLAENHGTAVIMGGVATRTILSLPKDKFSIKDFHGVVHQVERGAGLPPLWVIPTFHPAHLIRGAQNLTGVMLADLHRALDVSKNGWTWDDPELIVDPGPSWFAAWVDYFLEISEQDPFTHWLSVDVETEDKAKKTDEGDLGAEDQSYNITRINFSYNKAQGVTVPYEGPWLHAIWKLLSAANPKVFWNREYDRKRLLVSCGKLRAEGVIPSTSSLAGALLDFMWAAHYLQSDIPRGLGFWVPLYLRSRAWKHLSAVDPGRYAAYDGAYTLGAGHGICADLQHENRWDAFWRHCHLIDEHLFIPSQEVGMGMDRAALHDFKVKVHDLKVEKYDALQLMVPDEVKPLHPKDGWKTDPGVAEKPDPDAPEDAPRMKPLLVAKEDLVVQCCKTCGAVQVPAKHRCKDEIGKAIKDAVPQVEKALARVQRWYIRRDFLPSSPQQVLAAMKAMGHELPIDKSSGKPTTARLELEKLSRKLKDPAGRKFYSDLLSFRDYAKLEGTYAIGMEKRLDASPDGRLHAEPTHRPSTHRSSYTNPNLQNITVRSELGEEFRQCFVSEPGCTLISIDFSGIEAVKVGWFAGDPNYIRLSWLGVHDYLTSHVVGKPADLAWSDAELIAYFKEIKATYPDDREQCKRVVHGTGFGMTEFGLVERFPQYFPNLAAARRIREIYFKICPKLPAWHEKLQHFAYEHHYIGGSGDALQTWGPDGPGIHPYSYRHWFWDVFTRRGIQPAAAKRREREGQRVQWFGGRPYAVDLGNDARRLIAFCPQSSAAGTIKEAGLRLFHPDSPSYIGDAYHGRTPLRALVHDEFLLEVENSRLTQVLERAALEMKRAIIQMPCPPEWGMGDYLTVGVEAKTGTRWSKKKMEVWEEAKNIGPAPPVKFDAQAWEEVAQGEREMIEHEWDPDEDSLEDSERETAMRRALA